MLLLPTNKIIAPHSKDIETLICYYQKARVEKNIMNFLSVLKNSCIKSGKAIIVSEEQLTMIQKLLLSVLDDVIEVCNEQNIPFQLGGGSCLGAVRHGGYIPWDDDIDLNMFRKDVDRFIPAFEKKFGDKYWVKVLGKTEGYNYIMVHILTKSVRARSPMEPVKDTNGLCVDIFPIENAPDNALLRRFHGIGCMGYRYILSCLRFKNNKEELLELSENLPELKNYVKKRMLFGNIFGLIPMETWCRWAQSWITKCKNNNSEYVVIPSGQHVYFREMYKRSLFSESKTIDFAGRSVSITADYDSYMKTLYGENYMQVPPPEKREKHAMMELDTEALKKAVQS